MSINISVPPTHELKPRITVIGVGGAGCNAVNNMISAHLEGVEFLVANTDAQSLANSQAQMRVQLGANVTQGLGAGARPEIGRAAADESLEQVLEHVDGTNMLFVTAGMGGGTGTGAAPVIAQAARERGILTVGCVTKPFQFEGKNRMKLAEEGLSELQKSVDTLIVIPNQNLFRIANAQTTFADAFKMADKVLYSGVRGVTDLMVMPGLINLDFADVRSVMMEMGNAMMGTGDAEGDNRALEAAQAAIENPLLDDIKLAGARGVLINITGGPDLTLFEVDEIVDHIRQLSDEDVNLIFGASQDDSMHNNIRVSVVATGIDGEEKANPVDELKSSIVKNSENIQDTLNKDKNEVKVEDQIENQNKDIESFSDTILKSEISTKESLDSNVDDQLLNKEGSDQAILEKKIQTEKESFIPPQPEMIKEEEVIEEKEIKMDPFSEAEVLNASSPTIEKAEDSIKEDDIKEENVKESSGLIKRFAAKSFFGSAKKNKESKVDKQETEKKGKTGSISINKKLEDSIVKPKANELSLEKNVSVKSGTEKIKEEEMLDIPTFLRRQSD